MPTPFLTKLEARKLNSLFKQANAIETKLRNLTKVITNVDARKELEHGLTFIEKFTENLGYVLVEDESCEEGDRR